MVSTPLKNYESQLGLLFPIYGKFKNVPNRQPVIKKFLIVRGVALSYETHLLCRLNLYINTYIYNIYIYMSVVFHTIVLTTTFVRRSAAGM